MAWFRSKRRTPNGPTPVATIYTRPGCGLCREAEHLVIQVFGSAATRLVNIEEQPDLEAAYVFRVPVVVIDGEIVAEGRVTRSDLEAWRRAHGR